MGLSRVYVKWKLQTLMRCSKVDECIELAERYTKENGFDCEIMFAEALALIKDCRLTQALSILEQILEMEDTCSSTGNKEIQRELNYQIGRVRFLKGDFIGACDILLPAILGDVFYMIGSMKEIKNEDNGEKESVEIDESAKHDETRSCDPSEGGSTLTQNSGLNPAGDESPNINIIGSSLLGAEFKDKPQPPRDWRMLTVLGLCINMLFVQDIQISDELLSSVLEIKGLRDDLETTPDPPETPELVRVTLSILRIAADCAPCSGASVFRLISNIQWNCGDRYGAIQTLEDMLSLGTGVGVGVGGEDSIALTIGTMCVELSNVQRSAGNIPESEKLFNEAFKHFSTALSVTGRDERANFSVASCQLVAGDFDVALNRYRLNVELERQRNDNARESVKGLFSTDRMTVEKNRKQKDKEGDGTNFNDTVTDKFNDEAIVGSYSAELWNDISVGYLLKGKNTEAVGCFQLPNLTGSYQPADCRFSFNGVLAFLAICDPVSAFRYAAATVALKQQSGEAYCLLGFCLVRVGDFKNAVGAYMMASKLGAPLDYLLNGVIFMLKTGRTEEGVEVFKRIARFCYFRKLAIKMNAEQNKRLPSPDEMGEMNMAKLLNGNKPEPAAIPTLPLNAMNEESFKKTFKIIHKYIKEELGIKISESIREKETVEEIVENPLVSKDTREEPDKDKDTQEEDRDHSHASPRESNATRNEAKAAAQLNRETDNKKESETN